jgi:Spy/CpxP family protein refolding chaperone
MMSSKKYLGIVGAVLISIGLWSFPLYAQAGPGRHGPIGMMEEGHGMMLPLLLSGVNLTVEQKAEAKQIMHNHRGTFRDLFGQLRAAQEDMANKLFAPGGLQESDLAPQVQQITQLHNQLAQEGIRVMLEIRSVLTSEQLAKAAQLRQQMQALHAQMTNLFEQAPGDHEHPDGH